MLLVSHVEIFLHILVNEVLEVITVGVASNKTATDKKIKTV